MDLRPVSVKGNRTMKIVGKQSLVAAVIQPSPGPEICFLAGRGQGRKHPDMIGQGKTPSHCRYAALRISR